MNINKYKWSLDRLEIYCGNVNWNLLNTLYFINLKNEHRALSTRRFTYGGNSFVLVELDPNSYSKKHVKEGSRPFNYGYKIRINPADFSSSYLDFLFEIIGERNIHYTRIYRVDPSLCISKDDFFNLEILRNSTFINYQQKTEQYHYHDTRKRGLTINFTIGGGKSRYIFYDVGLKYSLNSPSSYGILMRKTGEPSEEYICIEHQMKRNDLLAIGLSSFFDLYELHNKEVFKRINFRDTNYLLASLQIQDRMDKNEHKLALAIWRYGLHDARKNLDKSGNFDKTYGYLLDSAKERNSGDDFKSFIQNAFKESMLAIRNNSSTLALYKSIVNGTYSGRKRIKTWADVKPFGDEIDNDFRHFYSSFN